jgi:hypothetical protein
MQTSQNCTSTPQSPRTVASEQPPDPSSLRQALVQTFPSTLSARQRRGSRPTKAATGKLLSDETRWRAAQARVSDRRLSQLFARWYLQHRAGQRSWRSAKPEPSFGPSTSVTGVDWERMRAPLTRAPGGCFWPRLRSQPPVDRDSGLASRGSVAQQTAEGCMTPATPFRWNFAACF